MAHAFQVKLLLTVSFPESYPDVPPNLSMLSKEGDITEDELKMLDESMKSAV